MVRAAGDRLESEYARILTDLGVSSHPTVTVRIWYDPTSYFGELTRFFGTRNQATGYITGPTELRLLAGGNLNTDVVHEFTHAVSLNVNPRFGNNPRWFWETVALYENGQFVHPNLIESVSRGNLPTLQQLNGDVNTDTQIYQLGCLLGEFIVSRTSMADGRSGPEREFMHVQLAQDNRTCRLEAPDHIRIGGRHPIGKDRTCGGRAHACERRCCLSARSECRPPPPASATVDKKARRER